MSLSIRTIKNLSSAFTVLQGRKVLFSVRSVVRSGLLLGWKDLFIHNGMNQMHNLGKAADRKSVRKIFGHSYAPSNTSHVKNTEGPAHACERQEPWDQATLSSHSIRSTHSVNIPSSPGAGALVNTRKLPAWQTHVLGCYPISPPNCSPPCSAADSYPQSSYLSTG